MMKYSLQINGLDQALKHLQKAPQVTIAAISNAVQRSIVKVESATKKEAPVNKQSAGGNLRQSIRSKKTGALSGEVRVGAKYAVFVHEGTKPHIIRSRGTYSLANRRTNQFFGRQVNHPGTKANPFLKRALEKTKGDIENEFERAVKTITESIGT